MCQGARHYDNIFNDLNYNDLTYNDLSYNDFTCNYNTYKHLIRVTTLIVALLITDFT